MTSAKYFASLGFRLFSDKIVRAGYVSAKVLFNKKMLWSQISAIRYFKSGTRMVTKAEEKSL